MDNSAIPARSAQTARASGLAEVWRKIESVAGPEHLRPAGAQDAIDGVQPQTIVEPATPEQLARVLAIASESGLHVVPRGGGSKLGWGNVPRAADLIISTRRLDRMVEHAWADMTATVEAGCTLAAFQRALGEHGQRLALDPLWPETATIGGILATNDSGPLRVRFGTLRDLLIGLTLALPDGTLARSGGKVVKNVAGYDLPKLAIGSLGTLGVITQAIFRLHPLPQHERTICFRGDPQQMNRLLLAVLGAKLAHTGLQLRAASGASCECDLRFAGVPAGLDAQTQAVRQMADGVLEITPSEDVWAAREKLWQGAAPALIAKFSILPSQFTDLGMVLDKLLGPHGSWRMVAQGVGVGLLQLVAPAPQRLPEVLNGLRARVTRDGGSVVVLDCPAEMKAGMDVWGYAGDALGLMARVKRQFDPDGTLNPGRFVGGL